MKGSIAIIVFLAVATLAEFLIVAYAMDLGVDDAGALNITWPFAFTISPLFHLVPMAVIITLLFTWMYLTKKLSAKPLPIIGRTGVSGGRRAEMQQSTSKTSQTAEGSVDKTKPDFKGGRFSYMWERIHFARTTIKGALAVFLAFLTLVIMVSLLAYPALIYQTLRNAYQSKSLLYYFVVAVANGLRGFAETVSPIGWIAAAINSGLLVIAPGIGIIGSALGSVIAPLANLDPPGKYLAFQNAAAWISVFSVMFYERYARKSYRYKKK